jgi:hypothetical protein
MGRHGHGQGRAERGGPGGELRHDAGSSAGLLSQDFLYVRSFFYHHAESAGRKMRDVVFLVGEELRYFGSSVLRGEQLCRLCRTLLRDKPARFRVALDERDIADAFVIVCKQFLLTTTVEVLRGLKARGNAVYADYLDGQIEPAFVPFLDGFVSSSRGQHAFLSAAYPDKRVVHVTHHVDLRIPPLDVSHGPPRCGYFGDPGNALFRTELGGRVDFIETSAVASHEWIWRLGGYRCHYAVRSAQWWDGHKPFTKGFVAAHVGAVILIGNNDAEAMHHLGDDYPFVCDTADPASVVAALDAMQADWQSARWARAVSAMRQLKERIAPRLIRLELETLFFGGDAARRAEKRRGWASMCRGPAVMVAEGRPSTNLVPSHEGKA